METKNTPTKVTRTTRGLRDALFEEIDALTAGRSNAQIAAAKSKLATQIISATRLDLEYHRFISEMRGIQPKAVTLTPLALGSGCEDAIEPVSNLHEPECETAST